MGSSLVMTSMKYNLNSFCIINTIPTISINKRVWITSICIINISVVYIAIKSSTSLSSSSIIESNSDVEKLPSHDSRATVKSSISSSSSSISSPGSPANGGIGSHEAGWNFSVSTMCFAPTSSSWSGHLPILEFAYNSSKHTSTGYNPFMLMYGFQPRAPIDVNIYHDELQVHKTFFEICQTCCILHEII